MARAVAAIAPGSGLSEDDIKTALGTLVTEFAARNSELLARRSEMQAKLDEFYKTHKMGADAETVIAHLKEIGYLCSDQPEAKVTTADVDSALQVAGPQLVVPVDNARYLLNAANARWGSLVDALYGTDAIADSGAEAKNADGSYNPARGQRVFAEAHKLLDVAAPLAQGASYAQATALELVGSGPFALQVRIDGGAAVPLQDPAQFVGFRRPADDAPLSAVLLRRHGLHIEIRIDRSSDIGKSHPAGIRDIHLEAALTTIADCEDSVAAVDSEDKANVYMNWAGLMRGDLKSSFKKGGKTVERMLNGNRHFQRAADGAAAELSGRSLMLVRNVGMHMYTDAVTTADGRPVPEGLLDLVMTVAGAMHGRQRPAAVRNSAKDKVYIVKPKMHGPDEVAFVCETFARLEQLYKLPANTLLIGIMDEERQTTLNLKACVAKAASRVFFINTGFLDRTGCEIRSVMEGGPVETKKEMKKQPWLANYELHNVNVGLETGLNVRGQIGKGMWASPDRMREMLDSKHAHLEAGATTAWVPSPTAATLHATHYHRISVAAVQTAMQGRAPASLEAMVTAPFLRRTPTPDEVQHEMDNNAQGILGYVVRWVELGVGCSKVPNLDGVGLMEDRATARISSQAIANWLHHGIVSKEQVEETFQRMAKIVDQQNAGTAGYRPMAPDYADSLAFQAALELVFEGIAHANGYIEETLHAFRRKAKARA